MSEYLLASATVEAERTVPVLSRASGLIREVMVEVGDRVREGDALAVLEDEELAIALDRAEALEDKRKAELARAERMYQDELLSEEQLEEAHYQARLASADRERAALDLRHTRITSPIDGVVTERMAEVGALATPQLHLFILVDDSHLRIELRLPERAVSMLRPGQRTVLTSPEVPGQVETSVERVSSVVDPESGTIRAMLRIPRREAPALLPGMFVRAQIVTDVHDHALVIPKKAVIHRSNRPHAYVVRDDTLAVLVPISTGIGEGDWVEVTGGLAPGDRVVVAGQHGLPDSALVSVIGEGAAAAGNPAGADSAHVEDSDADEDESVTRLADDAGAESG
jgi:RND family efflux transporter MFP subunit